MGGRFRLFGCVTLTGSLSAFSPGKGEDGVWRLVLLCTLMALGTIWSNTSLRSTMAMEGDHQVNIDAGATGKKVCDGGD